MPYTLQRKMFKLGGSVAHGGGITANLKDPNRVKMNKGGPVFKPGPDGKMRQHAIGGGVAAAYNALKAAYQAGIIKNPAKSFKAGKDILKNYIDLGRTSRGVTGMRTGEFAGRPTEAAIAAARASGDPKKIKAIEAAIRKYSSTGKNLRRAELAVAPTGLTATGLGALSGALPDIPEDIQEAAPLANLVQGARDYILEPGASFNPAGLLSYGLTGKGIAGNLGALTGADKSGPKSIKQVAEGEEITQAKVKEAAEADLRAEYERLLGGRPNPVGEIGTAIATALPSLAEDDLAGAASAYTQQLKTGVDKMDEYDRGVGQFILQNKITEDQTNQAMIAEALASGDLDTVSKIKKYQAAAEELGDVTPLPVKGKNKPDYDSMRAGTVYADVTTSTGSKYLAINRSGDDELRTNSADAAVNFANA